MNDCIWNVADGDRKCNFCTWTECYERTVKNGMLPKHDYVKVMNEILGFDCTVRSRRYSFYRYMIGWAMSLDGYTQEEIAREIKRKRCLVSHGNAVIRDMLLVPNFFPDEIEIWMKYKQTIKKIKDEAISKNSKGVAV